MSKVLATIQVEFGDNVDSGALAIVELDDAINKDSDGKVKTSFVPGDEPGFIVHYDHAALRIDAVKCSSGMVVSRGNVTRERHQQMQFANTTASQQLSHIPTGAVGWSPYGNNPTPVIDGRKVTATGMVPAIAEASYSINAQAYKLIPPPLSLDKDEKYPILVVVYMEAVE